MHFMSLLITTGDVYVARRHQPVRGTRGYADSKPTTYIDLYDACNEL